MRESMKQTSLKIAFMYLPILIHASTSVCVTVHINCCFEKNLSFLHKERFKRSLTIPKIVFKSLYFLITAYNVTIEIMFLLELHDRVTFKMFVRWKWKI